MRAVPSDLERRWRLAEARGVEMSNAVAADPLEVQVQGEVVMVGVDALGTRHLLIPAVGDIDVASDSSGAAISVRVRHLVVDDVERQYLDVSCSRPDLFDEFAVLSSDVVEAVVDGSTDASTAVAAVLSAWRELLRSISAPRLDRAGIIGLFAELTILERVVEIGPERGVEAWTGPDRARHDFQRGDVVVEVKGSTARRGRPLIVHGIDQLETPPNATLYLAWVSIEVGVERGISLRMVVDRLLAKTVDRASLEQRLQAYGYDLYRPEQYDAPMLTELETRWYVVDENFPRLVRGNLIGGQLPHGVIAVSYEVDLSGDHPPVLDGAEVNRLARALAGGR